MTKGGSGPEGRGGGNLEGASGPVTPGRDVCRDGTLFILGLHENVSVQDDFTRDNLQSQHNIVPAKREEIS